VLSERAFSGVFGVGWLTWESPSTRCVEGLSTLIVVPAVTYSPTPSRVQYHRRCGS
jgi:hypothetical protein